MDEYADLLFREQSNPSAALLQILIGDYKSYDVIVAVEGVDDRIFYFDFLRDYMNERKIYAIDCGGKRGVVGLKELVDQYDWDVKPRVLYLCDKDYDDYIGNFVDGIYYLPVYSIESFFSSSDFVDYIVDKFSKSELNNNEKTRLIQSYVDVYQNLASYLQVISAIMIEIRASGRHPDFGQLSIASVFDFTTEPPTLKRARWDAVREAWGLDGLTGVGIRARIRQLDHDESVLWLRGKYALQLAKTSYQRAVRSLPQKVGEKCPEANYFSSEAFRWAKLYLNEIPSLREYCQSLA